MFADSEHTGAPDSGLTWQTFGLAAVLHVALFLFILVIGLFNRSNKPDNVAKENIVPMDLTIVPPWAKQTDDPNPDPNPPPPKVKKQPPKQPPKAPEVKKPVDVKSKDALVKVEEKKKPELKRGDLKKDKKLQKAKPQKIEKPVPQKLPDVERPPDLKIPDNVKKFGAGTSAEKPLEDIDTKKMLEQGYRYGARNQLASSEAQRCVSLIKAAIDREWRKEETFNWYSGLRPIVLKLQLGAGGVVRGFVWQSGSGDADVDRTAQNALRRLKANGPINGLSAEFIKQNPEVIVTMEPTGH